MANRQRDPAKEKFWRRTMAQFRASGLNIREFCERELLSEPSFYAWRAELARRARTRLTLRGAHRSAPRGRPAQSAKPRFLPVRVIGEAANASPGAIKIILPGGRILRVRPGFDQATLAETIAVLERPGC
jgi:hypothetical protein